MRVGIEKINLYAGRFYLDIAQLAEMRGQDMEYIATHMMCESRSVYPIYEDAVTMAVNAAKRLLSSEEAQDIELLVVGTESAVDFGKPISTWVHRFAELPENCRNFEVKHACYGATGALKMAASWVAAGIRPGKKALVISTDFSRSHLNSQAEYICGGCAVAMLVSAEPEILELPLERSGYWTTEISDTFRPTSKAEVGNNEISLYSYLDALEGAYYHYEEIVGEVDYEHDFKKHIYHAPFPAMTFQAHRSMLSMFKAVSKKAAKENFQQRVEESLSFAKRVGSAYGASNFLCLLSLLTTTKDLKGDDKISLFAYGSGCQGEFYEGIIGANAPELVTSLDLESHLNERMRLSATEYEAIELAREAIIDVASYQPERDAAYESAYAGQGLLVLKEVDNYLRKYEWS